MTKNEEILKMAARIERFNPMTNDWALELRRIAELPCCELKPLHMEAVRDFLLEYCDAWQVNRLVHPFCSKFGATPVTGNVNKTLDELEDWITLNSYTVKGVTESSVIVSRLRVKINSLRNPTPEPQPKPEALTEERVKRIATAVCFDMVEDVIMRLGDLTHERDSALSRLESSREITNKALTDINTLRKENEELKAELKAIKELLA